MHIRAAMDRGPLHLQVYRPFQDSFFFFKQIPLCAFLTQVGVGYLTMERLGFASIGLTVLVWVWSPERGRGFLGELEWEASQSQRKLGTTPGTSAADRTTLRSPNSQQITIHSCCKTHVTVYEPAYPSITYSLIEPFNRQEYDGFIWFHHHPA